jgi:tocopherol O-methyltransferase
MESSSPEPTVEAIAAHYDNLDRFYRDIWGEHVHHGFWESGQESTEEAVLHLSHRMAQLAQVGRGDEVLDVGCGYGGTSRILTREYGAHVTGFTLSRQQYDYAVAQTEPDDALEFYCEDFLQSKLPENHYQALVSIECLEHIQDKKAYFRKAYQLLEAGGHLAISVWSAAEKTSSWQKNSLLRPICEEGRMPDLITGTELKKLIEDAGFELTWQQDVAQQVKKTWAICCSRLMKKVITDGSYRKFLWNDPAKDKVFALTLFRLYAAFETNAMSYWIFAGRKPTLSS